MFSHLHLVDDQGEWEVVRLRLCYLVFFLPGYLDKTYVWYNNSSLFYLYCGICLVVDDIMWNVMEYSIN